ncbi:hypothetical protein LZC95_43135 [Pendulispora brunnea]|uniref:Uncharacterized protein n=1 Tax=Pendulispora brunnea TaxID=2905690 RepID=A0ABZ2K3F0_9BACT
MTGGRVGYEKRFLHLAAALAVAAVGCSSSSDSSDNGSTKDPQGNPDGGGSGNPDPGSGWPGGTPNDGGTTPPVVEPKPAVKTFAELGVTPFDVDRDDLVGPSGWDAQYGKLPELVPAAGTSFVDVAVRNTNEAAGQIAVVRVEPDSAGTWHVTRGYKVRSLGNLLGFARGGDGSYYYATGSKDPDVTKTFPAPKQHRSNVLRALHFDSEGKTLFDVDIDIAREAANKASEPIVTPGRASSSRLSVAGNMLALVHGISTEPDGSGTRHQKAASTFFDASTGAIRGTSSIWVSHSFDQRHLVDGNDIYEFHLGDAYPRAASIARIRDSKSGETQKAYRPKGDTGQNNTFTRLGNLVRIDAGPAKGSFLALLATERTTDTSALVSGSRDLALVRLTPDLAKGSDANIIDPSFGEESAVNSGGENATNRLRYLTDYHTSAPGKTHAERPKFVPVGNGEFIVLYEEWALSGDKSTYNGTFAMRIDGEGTIRAAATKVSQHHLPRGDDAFAYGGGAAWITGDKTKRALTVHTVSASLTAAEHVIP